MKEKKQISIDSLIERYLTIEKGVYAELLTLMPPEGIDNYSSHWLAVKLIEGDMAILEKVKGALEPEAYQKYR